MLPIDLRDYAAPRRDWIGPALLALALIAMSVEYTNAEGLQGTASEVRALSSMGLKPIAPAAPSAPDCPRTHPWGREQLRIMVATRNAYADRWQVQCHYGAYHGNARFAL